MNLKTLFTYLVLLSLFSLEGCASGYKTFYQPVQDITPKDIANRRASPPPATPSVERSPPGDPQRIMDAYAKRGYVVIGSAMFNSGRPEYEDSAVHQAQEVGADLVLILDPRYTGSVTSNLPLTTPTTSTSYSSGTATAFGPGGTVTAYGSGTTTTYGSTTTYMPVTVHRSDYGAVFFVKQRFNLGVHTRDLNDAERQELQSNKGVAVRLVVDDTPAFESDILVGDIIISIDGARVSGGEAFFGQIHERRGKVISLSIMRKDKMIEKTIQLAPLSNKK